MKGYKNSKTHATNPFLFIYSGNLGGSFLELYIPGEKILKKLKHSANQFQNTGKDESREY